MSIKYIRDAYAVPAKIGGLVKVPSGTQGKIVSAAGQYVRVRLDGFKHPIRYHPNDLTYLTPEPEDKPLFNEPPTDDEILTMAYRVSINFARRCYDEDLIEFARAVLAFRRGNDQ